MPRYLIGSTTGSGDNLFRRLRVYVERHISFPDPQAYDLLGLRTTGICSCRALRCDPRLRLHAEKESPKTPLMEPVALFAFKGILPLPCSAVGLVYQNSASLVILEAEENSPRHHPARMRTVSTIRRNMPPVWKKKKEDL